MLSVLGVDVGGTKISACPVDQAGTELARPIVDLTRTEDTASFLSGLETTLRRAMTEFAQFSPGAVGLACAGTIDASLETVVTSPNLPLSEVPLARTLRERLGVPVVLENDANAALLGEATVGAAVGLRHVVLLTLGTGVGGALMIDGGLYRGASGAAGELGHTVVQMGGIPCRCGLKGCLEMYASGPALARYANARIRDHERDPNGALLGLREQGRLTGGAVSRLAKEGHPGAVEAVKQLSEWLGIGLVNITNAFDPEMIIVGGGVGDLGELLLYRARQNVRANAMPPGRDQVEIVPAKLGNRAGLVGAGVTAWERMGGASGTPTAGDTEQAGGAEKAPEG